MSVAMHEWHKQSSAISMALHEYRSNVGVCDKQRIKTDFKKQHIFRSSMQTCYYIGYDEPYGTTHRYLCFRKTKPKYSEFTLASEVHVKPMTKEKPVRQTKYRNRRL